jgi:GT2 family glycosyltransferase/glycosyltransferase involved in cell wall biosynthesis
MDRINESSGEHTAPRAQVAEEKENVERLRSELSALQSERDAKDQRISELREEAVELRNNNLRLLQSARQAQVQLSDILDSPAWKLIRKYRTWLRQQYTSHPGFFAYYERLAACLLARFSPPNRGGAHRSLEDNKSVPVRVAQRKLARHASSQAKDPKYQAWIDENEPGVEELARQRLDSGSLSMRPLLSIILPVYKIDQRILNDCVESVREQTYDNWELCVLDASGAPGAGRYLTGLAGKYPRIHYKAVANGGISRNSNAALDLAAGEFVIFLDQGDLLAPFALLELAALLNRNPDVDFIYSDHDHLAGSSNLRANPLFKPDWSPELMFSANYISHLTAVRKDLVDAVGRFNPEMDGAQDWDLFLRLTERTSRISHLPKILYHRRMNPKSAAFDRGAEGHSRAARLRAITAHMERVGMSAEAEATPGGALHVRWKRTADPFVSVIIPTRDKVTILSKCISSFREKTAYKAYEIVIVDTGSEEPSTHEYYRALEGSSNIRVLSDVSQPFNYSRANNYAVREARGDLFLFLNNDVEITNPEWLDELVGWGTYPPIGVVGAKLLYPDNTIQHAGLVMGLTGFAGHPFAGCPSVSEGPFGSTTWYRDYLAVTGACMLIRREVFRELGGFDEEFLLCGSDVEICLRARKRGYRVMLNPFAELIHYERQTRENEPPQDFPTSYKHYQTYLKSGDPYWSPNLSYWVPRIAFRTRDEESALSFAQEKLQRLGCPPPLRTAIDPPAPEGNAAEERQFVRGFNFSEEDLRSARQNVNSIAGYHQIRTVMWFIPTFEYAYYGGIMTILRFARQWHRDHGVRSMFAVCDVEKASVMAQRIRAVHEACKDTDIFILRAPDTVSDLPSADAGVVTLWATAYFGLRYRRCCRMFYFIQDYEPAFYRAGSASALAENTYRFGFYGITNTVSLRRAYETEYNGKAFHFNPCVDFTIFHPGHGQIHRERRWQVFCYARPRHPRNAFDLMAAAMRLLKRRLSGSVRIIAAGDDFDLAAHGLEGVVENRGALSYEATAQLYRECDVGVALMLTRHPSYIPLELMASGCLVVTNRNHWTEWLLHHEENCLLTEPSASCIAEAIERGLQDESLRRAITDTALRVVRDRYSDWNSEIRRVYEYVCDPDGSQGPTNV